MTKLEAYYAFIAADKKWQTELVRIYGRKAGDARYGKRGTATDTLQRLANDFHKASAEWENAQVE